MFSLLRFGTRRPNRLLQLLTLAQTLGHSHSMHSSKFLILGPRASCNVAPDDGFQWDDGDAADLHAAFLEEMVLLLVGGGIEGRGKGKGNQVGGKLGVGFVDEGEPVGGELG